MLRARGNFFIIPRAQPQHQQQQQLAKDLFDCAQWHYVHHEMHGSSI
jgi:hypothetical protein